MKIRISAITILATWSLLSIACLFSSAPNYEQQTKSADENIIKDETLKKLDSMCQELPVPDDFIFLGKSSGNNVKFVSYKYKTSLSYNQVKQFYDKHFLRINMKLYEERPNWGGWFMYQKNDDFIRIQRLYENVCSVSCADEP